MGRPRHLALLGALLLGAPGPIRAQVPVRDTVRAADTLATRDSVPPAVPRDSVAVIRLLPFEVAPGPLPPGARLVFTRDSLLWTSAYTLAELLSEVPGVYVARTGFATQPAPVFAGGRGSTALELFRDGVPVLPLGTDSVWIDPGRISLFDLRRVEVERLPGVLRVYLVSERLEDVGSRSLVRVVSGDFKTGGYAGLFQHRRPTGLGIDLTADFFDTQGAREPRRDAQWFGLRAQANWTPTPRLSATVQFARTNFARTPTQSTVSGTIPRRDETRTEALVRVIAASRPEREGLSFEAGVQTTAWSADSGTADTTLLDRTVHRAFLGLGVRGRFANAEVITSVGDHYTPASATFRMGWTPLQGLVLTGDGSWARHEGERRSWRGHAAAALFGGPFELVGDVTLADAVAAPMLAADTAQRTLDLGVRGGFVTRPATLRVGLEWRDAFAPPPLPSLPPIAAVTPSPEATFLINEGTLRVGPLALTGWFAHPIAGTEPAFEPPSHARIALTFRSKFWRTFRSGAFELKVQAAYESWSAGTAALDATGFPTPLPGAGVAEFFLQFQLVEFRAFYGLRNAFRSRDGFVPGLEYPRSTQSFGVKWNFAN